MSKFYQSQTLRRTLDLLQPRLLSGQVELSAYGARGSSGSGDGDDLDDDDH